MSLANRIGFLILLFVFFGLAMFSLDYLPTYITDNEIFITIIFTLVFSGLAFGFVYVMKMGD